MGTSKRKLNSYGFDGDNLDKRVDQFFEAGRQIVDGFSGTRPGTRKKSSFSDYSRKNVRNLGNWVNDKMDSFFEEDYEGWDDEFDEETNQFKSFSRRSIAQQDHLKTKKRPLEYISLRTKSDFIYEQKKLPCSENLSNQKWEEDSFFKINKWQRSENNSGEISLDKNYKSNDGLKIRNLPRSRRSRI